MTLGARLAALLAGIAVASGGQSPELSRYAADLRAADALLSQGDFRGVIERLEPWPERLPHRPEANHFLGLAHYRLREFGQSIRHLSAALDTEREDSEPWKQTVEVLGVAYYFEGRWQEARPLLEKASAWKAADPDFLYALARTQVLTGEGGSARIPVAGIFGVDPASPPALVLTARLALLENGLRDAETLLLKALEARPDLPDANYLLGGIALREGHHSKALSFLRKELENNPGHAEAWHSAGETLLAQGREAESVEALKRAIWLGSKSPDPYILLAKVHIERRELDLAEDAVRQVLQAHPRNYEAHFLHSRILYKMGRRERARMQLEIAEQVRRAGQPSRP